MTDIGNGRLELGLGLLSIGRSWGVRPAAVPGEAEADALLRRALDLGIRVLDTAPAYGGSEAVLGRFLARLPGPQRSAVTVMTKAGEHWDPETGVPFADHGRDALRRSIDRSLGLLDRVDVLQIHKATVEVVDSPGVVAAIDHARGAGVTRFGASVATVDAGLRAIETGLYSFLQFPFSSANRQMLPLLPAMAGAGLRAIVNRPFAMGALVGPDADGDAARSAFAFIARHLADGIVLTGTGKVAHLEANAASFAGAMAQPAP
ncbi:aldo/keto reductase [Azospirillum picis]|uniref:Aryl-alcohol dehydrogenase-like predicted oxidoreductase n=1 Tax=Azospirillum picis TaxID=488438 RepID=A0ABU0MJG3_9PROT|nr:aldo/keto reductase [Azospirillum picis]MBP2299808.1 aryl-alcohol dehydrogenase-like predicted oxidoreductase [Azospirillum picis]MDQ0533604.1 aryl-alcohol dehydrogenase-like predicted oxidoreductase [Azospirillum picis]